jgi:hypothetical protein
MPRGVPKSGLRRTRAEMEADQAYAGDAALAGETLDAGTYRDADDAAVVEEVAQRPVVARPVSRYDLSDEPVEMISQPPPGFKVEQPPVQVDPPVVVEPGVTEPVTPSPEQLRIKALEDQLALLSGRRDVEPEIDDTPVDADGEVIIVHFLEDGMTALGRVMYRGDELEFVVGSPAHKDTFNRNGRSWLDLRHDEFGQADRWGKIMFRNGPWPGKSYADGKWESIRSEKGDALINPPSAAEIEAAEKARKRRAAPRLPTQV